MSVRAFRLFALGFIFVVGAAWTQSAHAADKGGDKKGGIVQLVLKHADELKLTDEQKTKLDALAKEDGGGDKPKEKGGKGCGGMEKIKEILTPDQMTQLKEIMQKERGKKKGDGN